MAEQVKAYDGAVDGLNILHGIAVSPSEQATPPGTGPSAPAPPDFEAVIERASQLIGDRRQAMRWLGTPVRALDYATPISLLHEPTGQQKVLAVLAQLEHGVL